MKGKTMNIMSTVVVPLGLALLCAGVVFAALSGKSLPLISSPKMALVVLLVVGIALCGMGGIGQVGASGRWASPLAIVGYVLGAALLVVFIAAFAGFKLPLVQSETQALAVAALLMAVKYAIGTASFFFHWL